SPGNRATFWYFCTRASVSRATSSAGTSTEISRFTPSLLMVSVGLTFPFQRTPMLASSGWRTASQSLGPARVKRRSYLSLKTEEASVKQSRQEGKDMVPETLHPILERIAIGLRALSIPTCCRGLHGRAH